jgi:hypothetical protein
MSPRVRQAENRSKSASQCSLESTTISKIENLKIPHMRLISVPWAHVSVAPMVFWDPSDLFDGMKSTLHN